MLPAPLERVRESVAVNRVPVGFTLRPSTGVERERNFSGLCNHDVLRQPGIQSQTPALQWNLGGGYEVKGWP